MMEPYFYNEAFPLLYTFSIIAFAVIAYDKHLEGCGLKRIPYGLVFVPSLLFGAFGTLCGMIIFGNHTDKKLFRFGVPALVVIQLAIVVFKLMY